MCVIIKNRYDNINQCRKEELASAEKSVPGIDAGIYRWFQYMY